MKHALFIFFFCLCNYTLIAQKKLFIKIECVAPLKLKTGETVKLKVAINHNLKKEKTGTLQLLLKNHSTKDAVDESFSNSAALQKFTTLLHKKFETEFPFTVPLHYSDSFDIVLIAKLANLKDSIDFVVATNKIKAFGKKS